MRPNIGGGEGRINMTLIEISYQKDGTGDMILI